MKLTAETVANGAAVPEYRIAVDAAASVIIPIPNGRGHIRCAEPDRFRAPAISIPLELMAST